MRLILEIARRVAALVLGALTRQTYIQRIRLIRQDPLQRRLQAFIEAPIKRHVRLTALAAHIGATGRWTQHAFEVLRGKFLRQSSRGCRCPLSS